jgi:hypothetical protein
MKSGQFELSSKINEIFGTFGVFMSCKKNIYNIFLRIIASVHVNTRAYKHICF